MDIPLSTCNPLQRTFQSKKYLSRQTMELSLEAKAKVLHSRLDFAYKEACKLAVEKAIQSRNSPLSAASICAVENAIENGANDPYGDGDQSILRADEDRRDSIALCNAYATGLDAQEALASTEEDNTFQSACYSGDIISVKKFVMRAKDSVDQGELFALTHLLERRVSNMRLSGLLYACEGSCTFIYKGEGDPANMFHFDEVVEYLCAAGANVNARDICGFSALGIAAGYISSAYSVGLIPILHRHGANANIPNRLGESILMRPIMSNNMEMIRALLLAGADPMLEDTTGKTPHALGMVSSDVMLVMKEVQWQQTVKNKKCSTCGELGANEICLSCNAAFFCSKTCQLRAWQSGHQEQCGKGSDRPEDYVDVEVGSMTTDRIFPGFPAAIFRNSITGATSSTTMSCKNVGVTFIVKVCKPMVLNGKEGCLEIAMKNSDFLLVDKNGKGKRAHERLSQLFKSKGFNYGEKYLRAKWILREEKAQATSTTTGKEVLRLDISCLLPPPKPFW